MTSLSLTTPWGGRLYRTDDMVGYSWPKPRWTPPPPSPWFRPRKGSPPPEAPTHSLSAFADGKYVAIQATVGGGYGGLRRPEERATPADLDAVLSAWVDTVVSCAEGVVALGDRHGLWAAYAAEADAPAALAAAKAAVEGQPGYREWEVEYLQDPDSVGSWLGGSLGTRSERKSNGSTLDPALWKAYILAAHAESGLRVDRERAVRRVVGDLRPHFTAPVWRMDAVQAMVLTLRPDVPDGYLAMPWAEYP